MLITETSVTLSGAARTSVALSGAARTSVALSGAARTSVALSGAARTSVALSGAARTSVVEVGIGRNSELVAPGTCIHAYALSCGGVLIYVWVQSIDSCTPDCDILLPRLAAPLIPAFYARCM